MNRRRFLVAAAVAAFVVVLAIGVQLGQQEPSIAAAPPANPAATPAGTAGMITHIDPATGKTMDTPADPDAVREALGDAVSTSGEGLVQKPSPVPGGGVMVELDGRFMNAAVAITDSAGAVQCVPVDSAHAPAAGGVGR
jgi:hypothetical protein